MYILIQSGASIYSTYFLPTYLPPTSNQGQVHILMHFLPLLRHVIKYTQCNWVKHVYLEEWKMCALLYPITNNPSIPGSICPWASGATEVWWAGSEATSHAIHSSLACFQRPTSCNYAPLQKVSITSLKYHQPGIKCLTQEPFSRYARTNCNIGTVRTPLL